MKEVIYRGHGTGLNDGHLHGFNALPGGIYLTNGARRAVDTHLSLSVPSGLTVQIRGLREHRLRGVEVIDEDIVGPKDAENIQVFLHNGADATIVLESGAPIASVRIIETPARTRFRPAAPPAAPPQAPAKAKAVRAPPVAEEAPPVAEEAEQLPLTVEQTLESILS